MSDLPIIDPEAIASLKDLNPGDDGAFLKEILGIYVEDTPKRLAELRTFLASGDAAAFTRAAHTIKGSSANVGALALRSAAERLESVSKREGLAAVSALVTECEAQFARAKAELDRMFP
jgi:histidine phosphotransfer protein HptB